jgi:2-polyprenyl-6-methoxyphenol hydroxylase-like FAD-dependent oxidoreductase
MNFVRLLEYRVKEEDFAPYITLITNTEATDIQRLPNTSSSGSVAQQVTLRNTVTGNTQRFVPKLLLGCDGMNSIVRQSMQHWAAEDSKATSSSSSSSFSMAEYPSLSTDLRFKVLQLPPNPAMKDGTVLRNPSFCLLAGRKSKSIGGPPLRLGLLPIKDESAGRTANLITLPDHPVWGVTDAATLYKVFEEAFPQADWRALVPEAVMSKVCTGVRLTARCGFLADLSVSFLGAAAWVGRYCCRSSRGVTVNSHNAHNRVPVFAANLHKFLCVAGTTVASTSRFTALTARK